MRTEVNNKVAIATSDKKWARTTFGFAWGRSALAERLRALELLMGSQTEVIRASGLAASTYKSVLSRQGDMASERIGALARASGLSLEYLIHGQPIGPRDAACEEKRFDLAVRAFTIPSSTSRRDARQSVIDDQRRDVETKLDQLTNASLANRPAPASQTPPTGFHLIAPLQLESYASNAATEPAPLALANSWLAERYLSHEHLRYLTIHGDEGGKEFAAGTVLLIDTNDQTPRPGTIFAMNIGNAIQLRRIFPRLSSQVELTHLSTRWPIETVPATQNAPLLGAIVLAIAAVGFASLLPGHSEAHI